MKRNKWIICIALIGILCSGCNKRGPEIPADIIQETDISETNERIEEVDTIAEVSIEEAIVDETMESEEIADELMLEDREKENNIANVEEQEVVTELMQEEKTEVSIQNTSDNSITLLMTGDMLMHTPVNNTGVMEDGSIDFLHLFTYTKDMIANADIALVNQEVILGGAELGISGYPAFNTYYEFGDTLVETGFDVVLHATNHALDKGKKGVLSCLQYWENTHPDIAILGMQDSEEEANEIYVYEKNGIRISILNYTYGTNGIPLPDDMPYAVNLMDKERMARDIAKAKEISDFVVVCPHWGTEYVLEENDYQRDYAKFFLEQGVDLVLGTHPHVIEPIEWMRDENGNEMLVYYSLGNYVNCTSSENDDIGNRMLGALAEVTITKDLSGQAFISEYSAKPIVTYVSQSQEEIAVYPLEQFTNEMAQNSYTIKFDTDFSREYCEELWENVIGDVWNY